MAAIVDAMGGFATLARPSTSDTLPEGKLLG
jgi:hypothetical protein